MIAVTTNHPTHPLSDEHLSALADDTLDENHMAGLQRVLTQIVAAAGDDFVVGHIQTSYISAIRVESGEGVNCYSFECVSADATARLTMMKMYTNLMCLRVRWHQSEEVVDDDATDDGSIPLHRRILVTKPPTYDEN